MAPGGYSEDRSGEEGDTEEKAWEGPGELRQGGSLWWWGSEKRDGETGDGQREEEESGAWHGGVGLACQSRINAQLPAGLGSPPQALTSPAAPALCSASKEPMAQPLCTLLLLLAALAGSQAWSPEEEDRVIPGGIYDADLNDDEVQHALHFAISEYNKATEDEYYRRPLRVLRAREQVGAATAREVLSSSLVCHETPKSIPSKSTLTHS